MNSSGHDHPKILGIGDHVDCGSALLVDGKVVAAVNDERLVREKMVFGVPRESIRTVMEMAGLGPDNIDAVAVGTKRQHLVPEYTGCPDGWIELDRSPFKQALFTVASYVARFRGRIPGLERLFYALREPAYRYRRWKLRRILREEFGIRAPVRFVDHHYCHATAAYYSSDFGPEASIFTFDGGGDGVCSKVFRVDGGRIREIHSIPSFDSLGTLYSYVTQVCGFKASRHAGKVTGLSAHGEPIYENVLDSILTFKEGSFRNVARVFFFSALKEIRRRLPPDFTREDLAASVQRHAERLTTSLVRYWMPATEHPDVCMAGGVNGNVRINQLIKELPEVRRCFVHPGMSDCGIGLGAALAYHYDQDPMPPVDTCCLDDVYLGPSYGEDEMREALESSGVEFRRPPSIEREVARLLAEGAVVARFDGRMEYGPRALGNRTIMYQPTDPSVNDWLNEALDRTEFMPFAPAVLEEKASLCFEGTECAERTARFMTITFECTEWMKEHCPGVVHIDGTARPQLVREEDNPTFYQIIREYESLTGLPVVINTSFNLHEEPIVCTPQDTVRAFELGHLDYLAMGPFLARNTSPIRSPRRTEGSRKARANVAAR